MGMTLEAACRANLASLKFREGPRWTFIDPANAHVVSPAFATREEAEAWQAPFLEEREAKRARAEEAARVASENASLCQSA